MIKAVKYNPYMITLAMNSRGITAIFGLATRVKIKYKRLSDIVRGNCEITEYEMELIAKALDYPLSFFMQYPATKISVDSLCGYLPINYHQYKIMSK